MLTYNFDRLGRNVCEHESKFDENNELASYKVNSFKYENNKLSKKFTNFPNSENYLSDVSFSNLSTKDNSHFGNFICGVNGYTYSYSVPNEKLFSIEESATTKEDVVTMSDNFKQILNNNQKFCSHKTFIVSGWAKANSAFIFTDEEETYPSYITNRKFEIRVVVQYLNNSDEFKNSFDWRNTEWQYNSVEVELRKEKIYSIKCYIDYSNNTGEILYKDLQFKEGDFEITKYDSLGRPKKSYSGHSKWVAKYQYFGNTNNVSKKIIYNKDNENENYITTFNYTKENKPLRVIDFNGIVEENIYDKNGAKIKSITYHKDEPSSKFYSEQIIDENGVATGAVNSLGEQVSSYEYDENFLNLVSVNDSNGEKLSFGYDENNNLLEISKTIDGTTNSNTLGFTHDLLTSLKHNDFSIDFGYDNHGRTTKISVAGQTYLTKSYQNNDEYILAKGEIFHNIKDDDGNILKTYYKNSADATETLLSQNIYDSAGNLTYTKDYSSGDEFKYIINNFGQTEKEESKQHNKNIVILNSFDEDHNTINNTKVTIDNENFNYTYSHSDDINKTLKSIKFPNDVYQDIDYDKLKRINKLSISDVGTSFEFLKAGDHTTNLISKVNYFKNGKTYENLKYKYDEHGNIIEVRKNNSLIARYKYDGLSRLIREDNKDFEKTTTYFYDAGGNIETKIEYSFTLIDNLDPEKGNQIDYAYSSTGWKDKMLSYDGKTCDYDILGNPETYKGTTGLIWNKGRNLTKFGNIASYTYNSNGIRTSKTTGGKTTSYFLSGTRLLRLIEPAGQKITFLYGADGVVGFKYKNNYYYYKKNILGDIIAIFDKNGKEIVRYNYNAWGMHKCLFLSDDVEFKEIEKNKVYTGTNLLYTDIAKLNPFRYRGYLFDEETNLYYLNSRYYDPETGRYINYDCKNLYVY